MAESGASSRHRSLPTGGVAEGGAEDGASRKPSPLDGILNKIMTSLDARRKASGRPEDLEVCTELEQTRLVWIQVRTD